MSLPEESILPTEPNSQPNPAPLPPPRRDGTRRRRATRRSVIPADAGGQAAFVFDLSRRAYPSVELFVFSLACGAIIGLGFLLDSQAVLLLGVLVAPLMTPWVGFLLALMTGSLRFLFETLMALLLSAVIVFLGGLLSGFAVRPFLPMTLDNVFIHTRLWVPALAVLVLGAVTLVASFARSEEKPFLPSVIVAYAFYLPINAGGFGLGSGVAGIWPQGILIFLVHFSLACILGLLTFFLMRLRPTTGGAFLSLAALIIFSAALVFLMGTGVPFPSQVFATLTPTPAATLTLEPTAPPTLTPSPTATLTSSPAPSKTPSPSSTPTPLGTAGATSPISETPIFTDTAAATATESATVTLPPPPTSTPQLTSGVIKASEGGGANLRQTPNGKYLMTLDNGTAVEIYPDFRLVNGVVWLRVVVTRSGQRVEGWVLESVVLYSTPDPNFGPSATPTTGITPAP